MGGRYLRRGRRYFLRGKPLENTSGGYVPLVLAVLVYGIMLVWHREPPVVSTRLQGPVVPVAAFMAKIAEDEFPRVAALRCS